MWKSASILAFAFVFSQSASAALVDNGTYLTDTISGLDWLKLTQTTDRSYKDVTLHMDAGSEFAGWQYATGAQFETLLLNQGVVADTGCTDGTNLCGGANPTNYPIIDSLINAIGDTWEQAYNNGASTSNAYATLGLLSDSGSDGSGHYVAVLGGSSLTATPYARTHLGSPQGDFYHEAHVGSFLVRPSEVPLPAGGYLFVSAIVGLFGKRRFYKTN